MGRGNVQASWKTQRQALHGRNKGSSPSNEPDLAKEMEKNAEKELDRAKEEWNELDELGELEDWSSCTSSLKLGQLDQLVDWAQPAGPTVGELNSAGWSVRRLGRLDGFGVVTSR